jgi:hypothetical protein
VWTFISDTINLLPGNWAILGWIVFIAVSIAIIAGVIEAIKAILEMMFDAVTSGTELALIKLLELVIAVLLFPVTATKWLWNSFGDEKRGKREQEQDKQDQKKQPPKDVYNITYKRALQIFELQHTPRFHRI